MNDFNMYFMHIDREILLGIIHMYLYTSLFLSNYYKYMLIKQRIAKFPTSNMGAYCFCLHNYMIKLLWIFLL